MAFRCVFAYFYYSNKVGLICQAKTSKQLTLKKHTTINTITINKINDNIFDAEKEDDVVFKAKNPTTSCFSFKAT